METTADSGLVLVISEIGVAIAFNLSLIHTSKPATVNEARILADVATGNNWWWTAAQRLKHFSSLKPKNDRTSPIWAWLVSRFDGMMGIVSEPIVVDASFISAAALQVYAVELLSENSLEVHRKSASISIERLISLSLPRLLYISIYLPSSLRLSL